MQPRFPDCECKDNAFYFIIPNLFEGIFNYFSYLNGISPTINKLKNGDFYQK